MYKKITRDFYDKNVKWYEERSAGYLDFIQKEIQLFLSKLPGKRILDIGCGPGRDLEFFESKGLEPLGIDNSEEIIKYCRQKNLTARVMDFENLNFPDKYFDGVWALLTLLHTEREKLPPILQKIKLILKPKGIFFITMMQGEKQEYVTKNNMQQFRTYYTKTDLETLLSKHFTIILYSETQGRHRYLNFICQK